MQVFEVDFQTDIVVLCLLTVCIFDVMYICSSFDAAGDELSFHLMAGDDDRTRWAMKFAAFCALSS